MNAQEIYNVLSLVCIMILFVINMKSNLNTFGVVMRVIMLACIILGSMILFKMLF